MAYLSHFMAQSSEDLRATRALLVYLGTPDEHQKRYDAEQLQMINAVLTDRGPDDGVASFDELVAVAKERDGLGTFDSALPIDWCDDVKAKTGVWPHGFVWSYPDKSIWGEPFALTAEARDLLAKYKEATR